MVFSSLLFLFRFLPIVLLAYYVLPKKWHNLVLFLASLVFYAWGEPVYVILILFSTTVDYVAGQAVAYCKANQKKKGAIAAVCCSAVINLSLLGFFKYADFFLQILHQVTGIKTGQLHLPLPIGISFYTFQTMSYTIDVYRGDAKVQKNLITFGAYVSLFPQLIAGPIIRYKDVAKQLDQRKETVSLFSQGIFHFMIGLGKKVLIANQIGMLWQQIAAMKTGSLTTATAWLGVLAFTLQIYFDFSGYSDMAIGLGAMFGFSFPENFNYPYASKSITEFWRRWHISLGTWFREYVYIPLGGNRKGIVRQIVNLAIVWFLTGLWHGAYINFVLWGVYYGILLVIEKFLLKNVLKALPAILQHFYTMLLVMVGWSLFSWQDMTDAAGYIKTMFFYGGAGYINDQTFYLLLSNGILILIALFGSLSWSKDWCNRYFFPEGTMRREICRIVLVIVLLLSCVAMLVNSSYNPFLYFRF
ncbi:MBOAT family O-acyltransferase [Jutongia hominis]|uniref:MBOAT family protein n=1 Tax=Jutongia hominis TaxID=2763664 RepID=A0ABR7MUP7_9FIRM|nr:MBOAT family protein [Jutongia hominis]MBC8557534.1 MBOAT family protein [Jutongia hominis]